MKTCHRPRPRKRISDRLRDSAMRALEGRQNEIVVGFIPFSATIETKIRLGEF